MSVAKFIVPLLLAPAVAFAGTNYDRASVVAVGTAYEIVTQHVAPQKSHGQRVE